MLRLNRTTRGISCVYKPPIGKFRAFSTPYDLVNLKEGSSKLIFPWRVSSVQSMGETLQERGFLHNLKTDTRNYINGEIIRLLLSQPHRNTMSSRHGLNYMDPRGGEFLTGARQAFQVASNGIFARFSQYKKVFTDDDDEHWDKVIQNKLPSTSNTDSLHGIAAANNHETGSNLDQLAHIAHAVIFGASKPQTSKEPLSPMSDLAATLAKERAIRSSEYDTVSRGVAAPIEYIDEWDVVASPPSASYAPSFLSEVFDSRLALFYEDALARMGGRFTVHHTLHKMYTPSFDRFEVIFNAKRGYNFDLIKRHYIFGVIGVAVLGDPPQRSASQKALGTVGTNVKVRAHDNRSSENSAHGALNNVLMSSNMAESKDKIESTVKGNQRQEPTFTLTSQEMSAWLELPAVQQAKLELKKMKNTATIRVRVELPCKETFYVTDNNTGLIVQGKCIPVHSRHSFVLEGSLGEEEEFPTFKIVDIDNWLQGNNFI